MLDSARFGAKVLGVNPAAMSPSNWAHNNAIADWGENYISCSRYQGIFKFKPSGELTWVLAPHRGWREQYQPYLLTPLDHDGNVITDPAVVDGSVHTDDFDWVWGPHAPIVLPDEDSNDMLHRILVFDNGLARNFIRNNLQIPYSRAVIYEIDEANMTVRQMWDYGKDMPEYYTSSRSNAGYLPQTGHILFGSSEGATLSNGKNGSCILEIDPASGEVVFHLELENAGGFHRVYRLPLYPD
jgi:arylsulfate sulfotransferase